MMDGGRLWAHRPHRMISCGVQGVSVAGKDASDKEEASPVHVLPLYATLSRAAQDRVFAAVPAGHRLIVVATNVAETSLTIPGVD